MEPAGRRQLSEALPVCGWMRPSNRQETAAELKRMLRLGDHCPLPEPVPVSYFSNNANLFRHLVQAPIQTEATQRARALYHKYEAEMDGVTRRPTSSKNRNNRQQGESDIYWPDKSNKWIILMLVVESLLVIRVLIVISFLYDSASRSVKVSASKNLNTICKQVYVLNEMPSSPMLLGSSGGALSRWDNRAHMEECYKTGVEFIGRRYGKFLFWNASIGFEDTSILSDYLFAEQIKSMQMFTDEVILFAHIIGSLILFCGIMGSLVAFYMPYDVNPMLFIYDPTYCAFQVKARLKYYLNEARQSYVNYWSIFKLDPDYTLTMRYDSNDSLTTGLYEGQLRQESYLADDQRAHIYSKTPSLLHSSNGNIMRPTPDKLDPIGRRSLCSTERNSKRANKIARQVISLRDDQYDQFIPDARTQAFRSVLLVLYPYCSLSAISLLTLVLASTFVIFTQFNANTIYLNLELKQFLENGVIPGYFNETMASAKCNRTETGDIMLQPLVELVRTNLVDYLGKHLERLDHNRAPVSRKVEEDSHAQMAPAHSSDWVTKKTQMVIRAIAPTFVPTYLHWIFPFAGSAFASSLSILYMTIFIICIGDLCFWLFSLRVKLNICRFLLRYYMDTLNMPPADSTLRHTGLASGSEIACRERWRQLAQSGGQSELADRHQLCLEQIDEILIGSRRVASNKMVPEEVTEVNNGTTPSCILNVGVAQVIKYAFADHVKRSEICRHFAKKLISTDYSFIWSQEAEDLKRTKSSSSPLSRSFFPSGNHLKHRPSDAFLTSTYLEFRLFLEQIDSCRQSINVITAYGTIHSINIIASSMFTSQMRSKAGFIIFGYFLINVCLLTASLFQSQCTKLITPIYSILAASLKANKAIKHLAILWQRSLNDLVGQRSKFCFQVLSVRISYASALQFNFGVTSLYLLTVDRFGIS